MQYGEIKRRFMDMDHKMAANTVARYKVHYSMTLDGGLIWHITHLLLLTVIYIYFLI